MSDHAPRISAPIIPTDRGAIGNPLASSHGTMDDGTRFDITITDEELHLEMRGLGRSFVLDLNGLIKTFADAVEQHLGKARRIR